MLFWNRLNQESAGRVYFNVSGENPAHTPDTPHIQPLSCNFEWINQKHFYYFLLKPIRDNLAPGLPKALNLSPLHAQKSSGRDCPALKKISLMTYNAKKNLTPLYVGEKFFNSREVWEKNSSPIQTKSVKLPIPHSPTNVQWSCQPFRG